MYNFGRRNNNFGSPARDVSWHPHYPVIASTSFDSTVKIWSISTKEAKKAEYMKQEEEKTQVREEEVNSDEEETRGFGGLGSILAGLGGGQERGQGISMNQLFNFIVRQMGNREAPAGDQDTDDEERNDKDSDKEEDNMIEELEGELEEDQPDEDGYNIFHDLEEPAEDEDSQ